MHTPPTPESSLPVVLALLRSSLVLALPCTALLVLCGAGALVAGTPVPVLLFAGGTGVATYALFLCWRLHLDALLFAALAGEQLSLPQLDAELHRFTRKPMQERTMEQRITATYALYHQLLRYLALALLAFCLGVAATLAGPWATAHAATKPKPQCGDYQYTPLPGFIIKNSTLDPEMDWVLLPPIPWRRSAKDFSTPTIYCLTEENRGDYVHKLPQKRQIITRTNRKHDPEVVLVPQNDGANNKARIYFFKGIGDTPETPPFAPPGVIEVNEPGNTASAIFVINAGKLDNDLKYPMSEDERDAHKRDRMLARAQAIVDSLERIPGTPLPTNK